MAYYNRKGRHTEEGRDIIRQGEGIKEKVEAYTRKWIYAREGGDIQ